jgi:periplasmic divalent cation tolerance protein
MSDADCVVVLVTVRDESEGHTLGHSAVDERLAACCNLIGPIRSVYRWEGRINDEVEWLVILKTTAAGFDRLRQRILELHSYETPEVVAVPVVAGSASYLRWVADSVGR